MKGFEEFDEVFRRCPKFRAEPGGLLGLLTSEGPALLVQGIGEGKTEFTRAREVEDDSSKL